MPNSGKLNIASSLNDGWILVIVRDTGYEIPLEHIDNIFTPFFTTKEPGDGVVCLGLSVSYGIVEMHNGQLTVQCNEGTGSTFTVCLPALNKGVSDAEANDFQEDKNNFTNN